MEGLCQDASALTIHARVWTRFLPCDIELDNSTSRHKLHLTTERMAEEMTNGIVDGVDVEMKEEVPLEVPSAYAHRLQAMLMEFQASLSSMQQAAPDATDPNPAPQSQDAAPDTAATASEKQPETVVAAAPTPAVATPPAASTATARPGSMPPQPAKHPEKPVAHGGPTRQYLNSNVTPHLLEGMKYLAVYEPEKPLAWLADFLAKRSKEVEG